jgi:hypothetical protein
MFIKGENPKTPSRVLFALYFRLPKIGHRCGCSVAVVGSRVNGDLKIFSTTVRRQPVVDFLEVGFLLRRSTHAA